MWWIFLFVIGVLIFSKLDEFIDLYKKKDPNYQKEQKIKQEEDLEEQLEMTQLLQELIDCDCLITSPNLIYMSYPTMTIPVKILYVDHDWVTFSTIKKKEKVQLILPIKNITSLSKVI